MLPDICTANSIYSSTLSAHRSVWPEFTAIVCPTLERKLFPLVVIVGTPIQRASHVVVPPDMEKDQAQYQHHYILLKALLSNNDLQILAVLPQYHLKQISDILTILSAV